MAVLTELALGGVRRTERALGPAAALRVALAALEAADDETRRTLLLAGLGAALRASDRSAFASLAERWARAGGGAAERRGLSLVARLAQAGALDTARVLARAELARHRSVDALFVHGALGDDAALAEAARLGAGSAAGARAARALLASVSPEGADEAEAALGASDDPHEALRLAGAALGSARLYARVRTLDRLATLATDARTRGAALRIALAHADRQGSRLGALERDRVLAIATAARAPEAVLGILRGDPRPSRDEAAARDALLGREPETTSASRPEMLALRALAATIGDRGAAPLLLSALRTHGPSPAGWTAVLVALSRPAARSAAIGCAEAWLASGIAPPQGYAVLATTLARAEAPALAERAWHEAFRARERGAQAELGRALERQAHAAHASGDRARARALIARSLAVDPDPAG